jgi:hypothetical protein
VFVRAKPRRGAGGKTHIYYYLESGHREGGKVRRRTVAYLGKHDSIEEARAHAAALAEPEAAPATGDLATLRELLNEYGRHNEAYKRRKPELDGIEETLDYLKGDRTKAALAERKQLKAREDQIKAHLKEAEAVKYRATVVHDSLSEADQAEATKLLFYHIVDPRGRVLSVLREGIKRNRRRAS